MRQKSLYAYVTSSWASFAAVALAICEQRINTREKRMNVAKGDPINMGENECVAFIEQTTDDDNDDETTIN